jgi:hypothetical protein
LGKSKVNLSGNLAAWIVNWFTNIFKIPLQVLFNEFFEPTANLFMSLIFVPYILDNGYLEIGTHTKEFAGTLVVDLTLPQQPVF